MTRRLKKLTTLDVIVLPATVISTEAQRNGEIYLEKDYKLELYNEAHRLTA